VVLKVFLEQALDEDKEANQLSEEYNARKVTAVELWGELQRRYGSKNPDELLA